MRHIRIRALFPATLSPSGLPLATLPLAALCLIFLSLAPQAAADYDTGVTLYEDGDFRGASESFYEDVPYLKDTHFGQDRASSIRVASGCTVFLYSDAGFRGRSTTLTHDSYDLRSTQVGNDSISSLKVRCRRTSGDRIDWSQRRGAALYSDADFEGRREIFYDHDQDLRNNRIRNDTVSSVRVAPGCRLTLFSERDFRGRTVTLESDVGRLNHLSIGNDSVSSLKVDCDRRSRRQGRHRPGQHRPGDHPSGRVTLFSNADYEGRSEAFSRDIPRLDRTAIGNDVVSSVQVARGCVAVLFEDDNYRGNSTVLNRDTPSLHRTELGNDRASSLRIDCGRSRFGGSGRNNPGFGDSGHGRGDRDHRSGNQGGVTLFTDEDFEGRSETLYGSIRNLSDTRIGNDSLSSIQVAPECRVTLYRNTDFRGQSTVVVRDTSSLKFTPVGNDSASSIEVDCRRR